VRSVELEIEYNDKQVYISDFIKEFSFTDRTEMDACNDLSIEMHDVPGFWRGEWFPRMGATLTAKVKCKDWFDVEGDYVLDCGSFEIDDFSSSGLPSVFTISAVSVGITNSFRRVQKFHSFEEVKVSDILEYIAKENSFAYDKETCFKSAYDPVISRWEQQNDSDYKCLKEICEYSGLMLKITDKSLILFSMEEIEDTEPQFTIEKAGSGVKSYSFNFSTNNYYTACEVQYYDPEKKEHRSYIYHPYSKGESGILGGKRVSNPYVEEEESEESQYEWERVLGLGKDGVWHLFTVIKDKSKGEITGSKIWANTFDKWFLMEEVKPNDTTPTKEDEPYIVLPEVGRVLRINKRAETLEQAMMLSVYHFRSANMRLFTGTLEMIGRPDLSSGMTITLSGFGIFDDITWYIEEIKHSVSGNGYSSSLSIRGVMKWGMPDDIRDYIKDDFSGMA